MKKLYVLNDLHIGAMRTSGTTPASAAALRSYILSSFEELLHTAKGDLLLNGDLFDSYSVPLTDLLGCYSLLSDWLTRTDATLYSSCGNHDLSKDSSKLSSLQFLNALLVENFGPERVVVIDQPTMTPHGYVIPHLLNQEAMDTAIANMPACDVAYLHVNIDNPFATQSDHSLNVTSSQLLNMPCKHVVCGHEHHQRKVGKCLIPGNQIPTSISDCLNTKAKYYCVVENSEPSLVKLADIGFWYKEFDWQSLGKLHTVDVFSDNLLKVHDLTKCPMFIRVVGSTTAEQGVEVANAIASLRKAADSFVVSNAVKIESVEDSNIAESLESVKAFDVLGALREILSASEMQTLEGLK